MRPVLVHFLLAITVLLLFNCENYDALPSAEKSAVLSRKSNVIASCDIISFNNVPAGTLLNTVYSNAGAGPIAVYGRSTNPNYPANTNAAMVFNSSNPHPEDYDLGTPSWRFGGPGRGIAGESGPFVNDKPLGNIIVIQDPRYSVPNDDDVNGSTISFDFSAIGSITAYSLTVIDVEANERESGLAVLLDAEGDTLGKIPFPMTGSNGVGTVNLQGIQKVVKLVLIINGSMGIDNIGFCKTGKNCTYTQGYWKNHPEAWPVSSLTLGTRTYTKTQLLSILRQPVRGNGLVSLAHQLIAAKLNIANGASPTAISSFITSADNLIGSRLIPPIGSGYLSPSSASNLVNKLTQYNEGIIGPGHCR